MLWFSIGNAKEPPRTDDAVAVARWRSSPRSWGHESGRNVIDRLELRAGTPMAVHALRRFDSCWSPSQGTQVVLGAPRWRDILR